MKLRTYILAVLAIMTSFSVLAKNNKESKNHQISMAKVWFKDGSSYEGPLVKHWSTYAQKFTASGHNFHILPDPAGKSVKCKSQQTDSILIISSTHRDFNDSTIYVAMVDGRVPMNGSRKTNKMMRRVSQGCNVDFCKLPYMGNWMRDLKNVDQLMEYQLVRFHRTGESFVFYTIILEPGGNNNTDYFEYFISLVKESNPGLADAIKARFSPDKATRKAMSTAVLENPQSFVDFVDNYLTEHPE